jgi:hypothetical protein
MRSNEIGLRRLYHQRIAGERCTTPEEAVRWMGAMQAQDYRQALWAIGLRTQAATVADVEHAIAERKIVLTWPLRGTLHVVLSEDAAWMLALAAPRMLAADRRRLGQLGLDDEIITRCARLFHYALSGGKQLARPAMMRLLEGAGIDPTGQRGYHILWHVAQAGLICLGPRRDKQQTFVLLEEWVPESRQLPREAALAELAVRYFRGHGPATIKDFAGWTGLTITDARTGLEGAKPKLVSTTLGANEYWMSADAPEHIPHDDSTVYLLPGFDEFVLGYRDRGDVLAPEHANKVVPGKNGIFLPTIVADGRVVGTWKRTLRKDALDVTLNPFAGFDVTEERVAAVAARYSNSCENQAWSRAALVLD